MTPIEFANKYLTPPERDRYIENIGRIENCQDYVLIDYITDRSYRIKYFFDDFFLWKESPQGNQYWVNIKKRIARIEYASGM
jgi:hypothetical protein